MADAARMEQQLADLMEQGRADDRVAEAMRRFAEASLRVPPPVLINTGQVRYSTSGNS